MAKKGDASFRISVVGEGTFRIRGDRIEKDSDLSSKDVAQLISEVQPLVMMQVRNYATEMGFRGVRPILGVSVSQKVEISKRAPSPEPVEGD